MNYSVPVAVSRDLHGSGQLHVMELGPGCQMSQANIVKETEFKIDV